MNGTDRDALVFAQSAVSRPPVSAAAYNLLGAIHARLGERDAARDALTRGLLIDRSDPAAYINLGVLELESGEPDAAAGHFTEALTLDPRSEVARRGLAEARAHPYSGRADVAVSARLPRR
jgi:Flp pilus assembly protein TadD